LGKQVKGILAVDSHPYLFEKRQTLMMDPENFLLCEETQMGAERHVLRASLGF
jgi:hypothetical protein